MQESERSRRVAELLRRALSALLAREVDDHRVKLVSVTLVRVSRDLRHATIYVSSADPAVRGDEVERALGGASQYLRYLLGREVALKFIPALSFKYDDTIRYGVEMTRLIDSLDRKHVSR